MTFKPAHKNTDNPPGQIVNPIPRNKTIGGIIDRINRQENLITEVKKKLSFEEWWKTQVLAGFNDDPEEYIRNVWKAAQENK